jgi:hypothetical protein
LRLAKQDFRNLCEKADHRHRRLLRAHRKRPRRRADNHRYEVNMPGIKILPSGNVLATALANKLARIAWTVLAQMRNYETRVLALAA